MVEVILKLSTLPRLNIVANGRLVMSRSLEDKERLLDDLFTVLQPIKVSSFKVLVLPSFSTSKESKGLSLGKVGDKELFVDSLDVRVLSSFCKSSGVPLPEYFTFLEVYEELNLNSCIVLDEYFEGKVLVTVIKDGKAVYCDVVNPPSLKSYVDKFIMKYEVSEVKSISSLVKSFNITNVILKSSVSIDDKMCILLYGKSSYSNSEVTEDQEDLEDEVVVTEEVPENKLSTPKSDARPITKIKVNFLDEEDNLERKLKLFKTLNISLNFVIVGLLAAGLWVLYSNYFIGSEDNHEPIHTSSLEYYIPLVKYFDRQFSSFGGDMSYELEAVLSLEKLELDGELKSLRFYDTFKVMELTINPDTFDQFYEHLTEQYSVVSVEELDSVTVEGKTLNKLQITLK